jgi:hypothetical protein
MREDEARGHEEPMEVAHQRGQPPIIENPLLSAMAPVDKVRAARVTNLPGGARMERLPVFKTGGPGRMDPVPRVTKASRAKPSPAHRLGEQRKAVVPSLAESPLSYVRLRLHFEGGRLSIVGVREVPGPLVVPDYVGTGLSYEVLAEGRRIGLGSLPDANSRRAFTNIDQKEAALGHNPTELDSYDFDVRVPRSELSPERLPQTQIHLHQIAAAPSAPLGPEPLRAQLPEVVKTVASLSSIDLGQVEPSARAELARILGVTSPGRRPRRTTRST